VGQADRQGQADDRLSPHRLLLNWNNQNPNDIKVPRVPQPWWVVAGKKVYMTDQEYHKYLTESGTQARENLKYYEKYLNFDNPTNDDIKRIQKELSKARTRVKKQIRQAREYEEYKATKRKRAG
jgi:hypothetical protein